MKIEPIEIEPGADKLGKKDLKVKKPAKKRPKNYRNPNQKFDPKVHPDLIVDFLSRGYSQRAIITALKISSHTWEEWKKRPEVREAVDYGVKETEKFYIDLGLKLAQGKVKGNVAAWCFLCKNILGWKDNSEQKADPTPISISFGIASKPEPKAQEKVEDDSAS